VENLPESKLKTYFGVIISIFIRRFPKLTHFKYFVSQEHELNISGSVFPILGIGVNNK